MSKKLALLVLCALAISCASNNERKEIETKATNTQVTSQQALGGTIHDLIENSKNLDEKQKEELNSIIAKNKEMAMALSEKSYKFRAVLIEELLSGKSTPKRISILKKDIKKIESARLKNTFDTVEKISAIVSKHKDNKDYADHLINIERVIR